MKSFAIFFIASFVSQSMAEEVCYGDLGCFSDAWPFTSILRPVPRLPWSPEEMQTAFWLFTKLNPYSYQSINYDDEQSVLNSNFNPFRKTKIIIHGFISGGDSNWVLDMKNAILSVDAANVIVVDWSKGANPNLLYGQACANTRLVGAQVALLIKTIQSATGALALDFHIMGHSLGAHIAGYVGERMLNLGRITGLDPAEPYYQDTPFNVRLDPTDARYVDVIHTDGVPFTQGGWGMSQPVGHVDFYPNGGQDQPGCPGSEVDDGAWWKISCSHGRACTLMIDSIVNADSPMYGHLCADYETYKTGACEACPAEGCPTLGYYSDQAGSSSQANVKYYLTTGSVPPYANLN